MNVFSAIEQRRSVKHYDKAATLKDEDFQKIMKSVLLSPTSYNIQHWRFIRITDPVLRLKIKDAAWGQQQVADAAELIVMCADSNAWSDRPSRYWANADQSTQDLMLPMLRDFYQGKPQLQRDETMRSCGIAAQTLMLSAKALGYDTCPMVGFDADALGDLIQLPEGFVIGLIITIGKASKPAKPRGGQLPLEDVLLENTFRNAHPGV